MHITPEFQIIFLVMHEKSLLNEYSTGGIFLLCSQHGLVSVAVVPGQKQVADHQQNGHR
jgi:hypothetical protein